MQITNVKMPESKYSLKCPYEMEADGICVHNTYNDASAMAEISYMIGNNSSTSFHVAVDDYRVVTGAPFNRNCFHAGDGRYGKGNRNKIGIEICYSKSGGSRFEQAERNAAEYIAYLLKQKGWGVDRVSKHQDYANKYCPHRTLDLGWERFLNYIRAFLGEEQQKQREEITGKIANIQSTLNERYSAGLSVDNLFGPKTKKALVKGLQIELNKQFNRGLVEDGIFGRKTYNACVSVKKGARGNLTWLLQAMLLVKGYSIDVDGIFGSGTEKTVRAFQSANRLNNSGIADKDTFKKLFM